MSAIFEKPQGHTPFVPSPNNSKDDSYDNDFSYDEKVLGSTVPMKEVIDALDKLGKTAMKEEQAAVTTSAPERSEEMLAPQGYSGFSGFSGFSGYSYSARDSAIDSVVVDLPDGDLATAMNQAAAAPGLALVDNLIQESASVTIPSETTARVTIRSAGFLGPTPDVPVEPEAIPQALPQDTSPTDDELLIQMSLGSHLSSAVYCHKPQDCRNFPRELTDFIPYYSERVLLGSTQIGMFATYDSKYKFIRVVFRGSSTLSQWAGNANITSYQCGNDFGKAHRGFVSMYLGTRQQVWKSIAELMEKFDDHVGVQFTGHSLGGALALLANCDFKLGLKIFEVGDKKYATSDLFPFDPDLELTGEELISLGGALQPASISSEQIEKFNCPPVQTLYTFGQPLVGNLKFSDNVNKLLGKNYYRVIHGRDMVCILPAALGFYPAGIAVHFSEGESDDFTVGPVVLDEPQGIISRASRFLSRIPSRLAGLSETEREERLPDILAPWVSDHLYYAGVDYDAVRHTRDCIPNRPPNPTEPTSTPCSIM